MVVRIREPAPTKLYTRRCIDWQSFVRSEQDFITTFAVVGSTRRRFILGEIKKSTEQVAYKQMAAYSWKLLVDQEGTAWQPMVTTHLQPIPVQEIVKRFHKFVPAAPPIEVIYRSRELIDTLFGDQGKRVLEKVITLIRDSIQRDRWPLTKVEVLHVKDLEVQDWQYALLVLFFNSDFETADKYLHDFYEKLDILTDTFNDEEQDILNRMLFFDVGTTVSAD